MLGRCRLDRVPNDSSDQCTSIIMPLRHGNRVFGVIDIEFGGYCESIGAARDELLLLTDALARVVSMHETAASAARATRKALATINDRFEGARSPPLERPCFVVASPSAADEPAMEATLEAVRRYEDTFDIDYWQDMAASGNVNQQVADAITSCRLGVCYLSARSDGDGAGDGGGFAHADNANVQFEAGMLCALKHQPGATPASRIVIREAAGIGGPPPFDLASERPADCSDSLDLAAGFWKDTSAGLNQRVIAATLCEINQVPPVEVQVLVSSACGCVVHLR